MKNKICKCGHDHILSTYFQEECFEDTCKCKKFEAIGIYTDIPKNHSHPEEICESNTKTENTSGSDNHNRRADGVTGLKQYSAGHPADTLSSKILKYDSAGNDIGDYVFSKDIKEFIKKNEDIVGKICARVVLADWITDKITICSVIEREIKEEQSKLAGKELLE